MNTTDLVFLHDSTTNAKVGQSIIIYFAKVLLGYRIQNHGVLSDMFHVNCFSLYLQRPTTQYKYILTRHWFPMKR
jgi:hypothetical protein